jgi:small subunit ribosomal protein S16
LGCLGLGSANIGLPRLNTSQAEKNKFVAVKIKLKRLGKIHQPMYRVVVADSRTARNGRAIEEIGIYQPKEDPSIIRIDADRVAYWLGVGAQATEPVVALLKLTGDWQKFKGEKDTTSKVRVAPPKADHAAKYEKALKENLAEREEEEKNPRPKPVVAAKVEEPKAEEAVAEVKEEAAPVAEEVKAEEPVAEVVETPAEEVPAEAPVAEEAKSE